MERNRNITFRRILNTFDTIANKHPEIHGFNSGFMDEVDIQKLGLGDYPLLYVEPSTADFDKGLLTYNFNVYIMDKISNEIGDTELEGGTQGLDRRIGRIDAFSELLEIMHDIINEFRQSITSESWVGYYYGSDPIKKLSIDLELPITAEPFTADFDNELTGWSATFQLEVENTNNLCITPVIKPS